MLTSLEKFQTSVIALVCVITVFGFIGAFGASMAFQSLRGCSTTDGFFMIFVLWLARRSSPASILLTVVAASSVSLVLGLALGFPTEVKHAAVLLGAWAAFHLQILLHEWGHYAAAARSGYAPYRVVGGALCLQKDAEGWTPTHEGCRRARGHDEEIPAPGSDVRRSRVEDRAAQKEVPIAIERGYGPRQRESG